MLKTRRSSTLLIPFESLVNRCIAQDMKLAEGISGHSGRTLHLELTAPAVNIYVGFYPASVVLSFDPPDYRPGVTADRQGSAPDQESPGADTEQNTPTADAKISGSALAMLRLLTEPDANRSLVNPAIQISGDVEFVQSVYRLFSEMQIDWQEPLSRVIGDVPTHGVQQFLESARGFARQTSDSIKRSLDEYLHEEGRVVPPLSQVDSFDQELDALRLRLDRLQARVQQLNNRLDSLHQQH